MGTAISTMMDKGLVVIPKEIRDQMGFKKGDKLVFVKLGSHISFSLPQRIPLENQWAFSRAARQWPITSRKNAVNWKRKRRTCLLPGSSKCLR